MMMQTVKNTMRVAAVTVYGTRIMANVTEENRPQFVAQLNAWSLGGELEDYRFTGVIPAGVKQVEFGKVTAGSMTASGPKDISDSKRNGRS